MLTVAAWGLLTIGGVTLIIAAGFPSYAVLVADRLISTDEPIDSEFEKTAEVRCEDARFGMAFTGVAATWSEAAPRSLPDLPHMPLPAKLYRFNAGDWMVRAMGRVANEELLLDRILARFTEAATEQWAKLPHEFKIAKADSAIAFLLIGFRYATQDKTDPVPFHALVSNYDDAGHVRDAFQYRVHTDQVYIALAGMHWAPPKAAFDDFGRSAQGMASPNTILAKAVRAIREASRTTAGNGKIGGQCSSLLVPGDLRLPVEAKYYTEYARRVLPRPPIVDAQRGRPAFIQTNFRVWVKPEDGPIVGPKIRRDDPCWCGSGLRLKQCHRRS